MSVAKVNIIYESAKIFVRNVKTENEITQEREFCYSAMVLKKALVSPIPVLKNEFIRISYTDY